MTAWDRLAVTAPAIAKRHNSSSKRLPIKVSSRASKQKRAAQAYKAKALLAQAVSQQVRLRKEEAGLAAARRPLPAYPQAQDGAADVPVDSRCAAGAVGDAKNAISTKAFGRG